MILRLHWLGLVLLSGWFCAANLFATDTGATSTQADRKAVNLEALSRLKGLDLEANPGVKAVVLKLLDQVQGTPEFVEIVRDFHIQGQTQGLLAMALKDPAGPNGAEAMRLVLQSPDTNAIQIALDGTNAASIVEALGNTGEKEIVPWLRPLVPDLAKPVSVRKKAVQALVKTQDGTAVLLAMSRSQQLPADLRLLGGAEEGSRRAAAPTQNTKHPTLAAHRRIGKN